MSKWKRLFRLSFVAHTSFAIATGSEGHASGEFCLTEGQFSSHETRKRTVGVDSQNMVATHESSWKLASFRFKNFSLLQRFCRWPL